ncbi:hypothetical protein ACPV49_24165, partial [Vibrio chagasii]
MKYTKRSLVGLFTLLIIPTGGAQAANNAPYPFGEEFVYHTCPSGFDKQGLSCTKKITRPVKFKCDSGFRLGAGKCTKVESKAAIKSCPSGMSLTANGCSKLISESGYSLRVTNWLISSKSSQNGIYWNSVKVFGNTTLENWTKHSDGWEYKTGRKRIFQTYPGGGYKAGEVHRRKNVLHPATLSCQAGFKFSNSMCKKTIVKRVTPYCTSGDLSNNLCTEVIRQVASRHSPLEETMATLYPRYSDDAAQQNAAAFRYLDNMFTLDPELGDIVSTMSSEGLSQDFSKLWANAEKSTADNAIEVVEGFAALQPDLPYLKEILFDVYYDRAAAEFILANR